MEKYNGWANRNTWLINMYFGDMIADYAEEGEQITDSFIHDLFVEIFDMHTEDLDPLIMEFIDVSDIDWQELADHYNGEEDE